MSKTSEVKYSIRQYLSSYNRFTIPSYQRGYKWGVQKMGMQGNENDASILVNDIIDAYKNDADEYFIQGVTVYLDNDSVVLIDGQQRTTTIFLLLRILLSQEEIVQLLLDRTRKKIKLGYDIRISSQNFLTQLILSDSEFVEEDTQDIFYMKLALQFMKEKIDFFVNQSKDQLTREHLKMYILDRVKLFFIQVEKDQANSIFSLMNGAKAAMKTDELIKANYLIKASNKPKQIEDYHTENINATLGILLKQVNSQIAYEWDINAVRSRYARMWDRWMYWWKQDEVKLFFRCGENPMGLLLEFFYNSGKKEEDINYSNDFENLPSVFKAFSNKFISNPMAAVLNLEQMRKFQKRFEDIYNDIHIYNYLGYALAILNEEGQKQAIRYAFDHFKEKEKMRQYARLVSIGCSTQIIEKFIEDECTEAEYADVESKVNNMIKSLSENDVYNRDVNHEGRNNAFRQLYRLNIKEQDRFGKFAFIFYDDKKEQKREMYEARSLEHIWPKSKVVIERSDGTWYYYADDEAVDESDVEGEMSGYLKISTVVTGNKTSHNSIGNIVFLNHKDNSSFNNCVPEQKKQKLFTLEKKIYSRNCPHTIAAFAKDHWTIDNALDIIKMRKTNMINGLIEDYKFVTLKTN